MADSQNSPSPLKNKNFLYTIFLLIVFGVIYISRLNSESRNLQEVYFNGVTMGVVGYNIKYLSPSGDSYQEEVDALLKEFNQALSTYIPNSEISIFNKGENVTFQTTHFYKVLNRSKEIFEITDGAFNPTVMPLVNSWGFGPDKEPSISEENKEKIDSLLTLVDFASLSFDEKGVQKSKANVQLDFSAIAKGYAVDLVADFLSEKGINDMMVEIGGEVVCKGKNKSNKTWVIGINNPEYMEIGGEALTAKIQLENRALATSGNYHNYYIKDGKKYAHTIDPKTGYPVEHSLLSASVFAKDCMSADAFATAFMVMGKDKAIKIINSQTDLEGFLIYDNNGKMETYQSPGLDKFVVE